MKKIREEDILDAEEVFTKEELEELEEYESREPKYPANDPTWFKRNAGFKEENKERN